MTDDYRFHAKIRAKLYSIIFGTHSIPGRNFDIALLFFIVTSVAITMADSIPALHAQYATTFWRLEWLFTLVFCIEYGLRLYCSPKPVKYALSFFGIVDLISILPMFIALFFADVNYLIIIRLLRVLRVFRVLKLFSYISEASILGRSLVHSRRKILVFFSSVAVIATVLGATLYIVEGPDNGFDSIPKGIYWAIVTITTVGYGDIVPQTPLGKVIASFTMLLGYAIIAIPTGIVTSELSQEMTRQRAAKQCHNCKKYGHDNDAKYCKFCGAPFSRQPLPDS